MVLHPLLHLHFYHLPHLHTTWWFSVLVLVVVEKDVEETEISCSDSVEERERVRSSAAEVVGCWLAPRQAGRLCLLLLLLPAWELLEATVVEAACFGMQP